MKDEGMGYMYIDNLFVLSTVDSLVYHFVNYPIQNEYYKKMRERSDKLSDKDYYEIKRRVQNICDGTDSVYTLDTKFKVSWDALDRKRFCWRLLGKNKTTAKLWGVSAYTSFKLWDILTLDDEEEMEEELSLYKSIGKTKNDLQLAHKCGNNDCCNPDHTTFVTQTENEIHKHYHFFLHNPDSKDEFVELYKSELIKLDLF